MNEFLQLGAGPLFAAAAGGSASPMAGFGGGLDELGWPDGVVVILLGVGLMVGRRRGMSTELLDVMQWLLIVVLGGFFYESLSQVVLLAGIFNQYVANLLAYVTIAIVLKLIFSSIKRAAGEKIVSANVFGALEYYLGMLAGMLRFACVVFFVFCLLNARLYSPKEVADMKKFQQDNFGSISFPTLIELQEAVFKRSFTGPLVKSSLDMVMIKPTTVTKDGKETIRTRRERDVFDAMKPQ